MNANPIDSFVNYNPQNIIGFCSMYGMERIEQNIELGYISIQINFSLIGQKSSLPLLWQCSAENGTLNVPVFCFVCSWFMSDSVCDTHDDLYQTIVSKKINPGDPWDERSIIAVFSWTTDQMPTSQETKSEGFSPEDLYPGRWHEVCCPSNQLRWSYSKGSFTLCVFFWLRLRF